MIQAYREFTENIWWIWFCTMCNSLLLNMHSTIPGITPKAVVCANVASILVTILTTINTFLYGRNTIRKSVAILLFTVINAISVLTLVYIVFTNEAVSLNFRVRLTLAIQPLFTIAIIRTLKTK